MPNYASILNAIVDGSIENSRLSSAAARSLDAPRLLHWEPGSARASWRLDPKYLNSRGQLFGGYYAVLADFALAYAAMTVLEQDEEYITQDLALSFFKPMASGTLYFAAEVLTRTRSRVCVHCRVVDDSDTILAHASATQHVRRIVGKTPASE
jgi:uncharacterized protein (TIGR00369 family)